MTWKRNLGWLIRIFAVLSLLILIHLITHSHVYCYLQKGTYFPNFHPAREIRNLYSFENLTMISPQDVMNIRKIWEEELSKVTLQGNRSVNDQMIGTGGQPERVLLITTWRSGSAYVGSIIRNRPGTHYFYEPLFNSHRNTLIHGESEIQEALDTLRNLLHCRNQEGLHITKLDNPIAFFSRNSDLWKLANRILMQWDPTFVTVMCRRSPILAMKIVRLRLRHAMTLLEDEKLNVKVIYLVRDPRATMNSRLKQTWCQELPDCTNFSVLCSHLVDDYNVAKNLEKEYPHRFMVLRYEDLLTRSRTSNQLFQFLNMKTNAFATKGKSQLTKWTAELRPKMDFIRNIQDACAKAMDLWGYIPIKALPTNLSAILKSSVN